jgi:hypothetical protein
MFRLYLKQQFVIDKNVFLDGYARLIESSFKKDMYDETPKHR